MESSAKVNIIIDLFEKYARLSENCKIWMKQNLKFKDFLSGEYLFEAGTIPRRIYFIFSGLAHYYVDQEGVSAEADRSVCSWFLSEGDVVIPVVAFYERSKTAENVRALEQTDTAYLEYDDLVYLYTHFPETNIVRAALTEIYRVKERSWHIRLATCSAEENYQYLRSTNGNLIKRIKTNDKLASYLSISKRWVIKLKQKFGD